jgi:hypothetical protein
MGSVERITNDERAEAIASAIDFAQSQLGDGSGFVSRNVRLGSLSRYEWNKLAEGFVSGWIIARSKQLTRDRFADEAFFLATGEVPEPSELGVCAAALPELGDLVEKLGLADQPVGAWSREQILIFVWTAAELVLEARTAKDERPGPMPRELEDDVLMAG